MPFVKPAPSFLAMEAADNPSATSRVSRSIRLSVQFTMVPFARSGFLKRFGPHKGCLGPSAKAISTSRSGTLIGRSAASGFDRQDFPRGDLVDLIDPFFKLLGSRFGGERASLDGF